MKLGKIIVIGLIILLVIGVISVISGYNKLVDLDVEISENESQVVNRLNQRQETIAQLLPTVVGLQEHAENIYQMITDARSAYSTAQANDDIEGMIEADALEVEAMNQLLVIMEDNPENIYAGEGFIALMDQISALESSLSYARLDYNNSVGAYNKTTRRFPTVLIASSFGFEKEKPYWRMNDGAEDIPEINFNN